MAKSNQARDRLLMIVREAIKQDEALRKQLQVGEKFRFIREGLQSMLANLEAEMQELKEKTEQPEVKVAEDDVNVYVYIFNSQGLDVSSWRRMVGPDVYYEYSVSRPIYLEKSQVEKFIDSKPTRVQHGYLTVAVKKDMILPKDEAMKDAMGNQVVKVKEGALKIDRVISFTHNNINYQVSPKGELTVSS